MTSEAQKRSADTTVNVMLGGGRKKRYSWMDTGGGSGIGSPAPSSPGGVVASPVSSVGTNREDEKLRGRTVERAGWITLKDALEAIEGDGGGEGGIGLGWHSGGKALWKGWARVKD
jgi:Transcription initiation factor TFIID component TAF4 family